MLRVDFFSVDDDIKDPTTPTQELRLEAELVLYFGRQTGSPRQVVSNAAVVNDDVHDYSTTSTRTVVTLS